MKHVMPLVAAVLLSFVGAVGAQTPPPRAERPYRGLFGGGIGETQQLLTASASLGAGYDDNVFADSSVGGDPAGSADPRQARNGSYAHLSGAVGYSLNRTRISLGASLGSSIRYYSDAVDGSVEAYSGSVGAIVRLSRRQAVTVNQTVRYQPYVELAWFPRVFDLSIGEGASPLLDLMTTQQSYFTYDSTVDYSVSVGRLGALEAGYLRQLSDFDSAEKDLARDGVYARYRRGIRRGLGVRLGYGYSEGRYPGQPEANTAASHTWDVGLELTRTLSFSRRTTFAFSTGSSAIDDRGRRLYRFTGDARLNHEIGRTWNAALAYSRGLGFVARFGEPFFSDSLHGVLGGLLNRRLEFRAGGGAIVGSLGLTGDVSDFNTYYASTGLTYAVTRHVGLAAEYFHYRYQFDATAALPDGFSRKVDRGGVRASLRLWAPLLHRERRPDAAR